MPLMVPYPIAERVTSSIREAMRQAGISQARLAGELGMTQQAISRRLTGEVAWSLPEIERTSIVLGVDFVVPVEEVAPASPEPEAADQ